MGDEESIPISEYMSKIPNPNKNELLNFCHSILRHSEKFEDIDNEDNYIFAFFILASEYLATHTSRLLQSENESTEIVLVASQVSKIILSFLCTRLKRQKLFSLEIAFFPFFALSTKSIFPLPESDHQTLSAYLNRCEVPTFLSSTSSLSSGSEDTELRPQTDITTHLQDFLSSSLQKNTASCFWSKNMNVLISSNAADLFLDILVHHSSLSLLDSETPSLLNFINISSEIRIVKKLLSLNSFFEPLKKDRCELIAKLAYLALRASGTFLEDETQEAIFLHHNSLDIFNLTLQTFKISCGKSVYHNFNALGVIILMRNFEQISSSKNFNSLSVLLSSAILTSTSLLMEDVSDFCEDYGSLHLFSEYSGTYRLNSIFSKTSLVSFLLEVSSISFRKSCLVVSSSLEPLHSSSSSLSFEETEEEENEPLLGKWLKNTLFPPEMETIESSCQVNESPSDYVALSCRALYFLNDFLLTSTSTCFSKSQMTLFAQIIKDFDVYKFNSSQFKDVELALCTLTHNLLSSQTLSFKVQVELLELLGMNPWNDSKFLWPLSLAKPSLALLAQILLLQQSRGGVKQTAGVYVKLWEKLLESSKAHCSLVESPRFPEILNVETIQLFLFLFHGLSLMQKKGVLLHLGNTLIQVSSLLQPYKILSTSQILILSRLVLIFEYMMRHLYEPPGVLLTQIQNNLFSYSKEKETSEELFYIHYRENYDCKPLYFNLFPENTFVPSGTVELPKLDGLAASFILGSSPESEFSYDKLYDSLLRLLDLINTKSNDYSYTEYAFSLLWRTILSLPPSLGICEDESTNQNNLVSLLHSLFLSSRMSHKVFGPWIKDALVKQGSTTSRAESLLKSYNARHSLESDVRLLQELSNGILSWTNGDKGVVIEKVHEYVVKIPKDSSPSFLELLVLDALMAKVQIELDRHFLGSENDPSIAHLAQSVIPTILYMVSSLSTLVKSLLLSESHDSWRHCLSLSGARCSKTSSLHSSIFSLYPPSVLKGLQDWKDASISNFPPVSSWRNHFNNEGGLASEYYLSALVKQNLTCLSVSKSILPTLKHLLYKAVRFTGDLFLWCPDNPDLQRNYVDLLFPLILDATTENLSDLISLTLERLVGSPDSEEFLGKVYHHVLTHGVPLLLCQQNELHLDERILEDIVVYLESMLEQSTGIKALGDFFSQDSFLKLLLSSSEREPSTALKITGFFNKILMVRAKNSENPSLRTLTLPLTKLDSVSMESLQFWLSYLVNGPNSSLKIPSCSDNVLTANLTLLRSLTDFVVEGHHGVATKLLQCLIPLGSLSPASEGLPFIELLDLMKKLAGAGTGFDHVRLITACSVWMDTCRSYLGQKNVLEKLEEGILTGKHGIMLRHTTYILSYISDILLALKKSSQDSLVRSTNESRNDVEENEEWIEDTHEEEEDVEDSFADEDSDDESLSSKLCTFTVTQKEFMTQHWYHCHTCRMVGGVGVCSVCVKVCHADHDVSYSKHGSFFCDCGARENGSCIAIAKRCSKESEEGHKSGLLIRRRDSSSSSSSSPSHSTLHCKEKETESCSEERKDLVLKYMAQLSPWRPSIISLLSNAKLVTHLLELLSLLLPVLRESDKKQSSIGRLHRIQRNLLSLHSSPKTLEMNESLLVPTLGSQEGAFENVRMNYSGEQGTLIRQLMSTHNIRRILMAPLVSSTSRTRQHLAVSHEKGKITVLQLSALLKQADSSQKKLTLTRLSSAPVPFTVLSVNSNPRNENYLAVCGLKDIHVLTFNSNGTATEYLILHPQLESSNYIIKSLWIPGSQTELALITADFVKIYNLSQDVLSPSHYFLVPSGKVRDVTLAFMADGLRYVLIMSSAGHIYTQSLTQESSAEHGPFYVTNIMDVNHSELKDVSSELICGGGVSIFYCHSLQLLFFSYVSGKSFMGSLKVMAEELTSVFRLTSPGSNKMQPLTGWSEIPSHPGLITAFMQSSNNPVILLVTPTVIYFQEIKGGGKGKVIDMVAIRHNQVSSFLQRTTLILLCEDGSLKIYSANSEGTDFWLTPSSPSLTPSSSSRIKQKKHSTGKRSSSVNFPIDFFEHCSTLSDLDFGGNDVLQIYNAQQIKHRLNTNNLYIANTKASGFVLDVINNEHAGSVIVGVRLLLGAFDSSSLPSYIEILGRTIPVSLSHGRWLNCPLLREESLCSDKTLSIRFGPPLDSSGVNILESILVYGKSKEAFGWPEDYEDGTELNTNSSLPSSPTSPFDHLLSVSLEVLNGCFSTVSGEDSLKNSTILSTTSLLNILPRDSKVFFEASCLLSTLFGSRAQYYAHKDDALLSHIFESFEEDETDVENYHRLIFTCQSIGAKRPSHLLAFALKNTSSSSLPPSSQFVSSTSSSSKRLEDSQKFLGYLTSIFWKLLSASPINASVSTLSSPGLRVVEPLINGIMEILLAFTSLLPELISFVTHLLSSFLLSKNLSVSFASKTALLLRLRPTRLRTRRRLPSGSSRRRSRRRSLRLSKSPSLEEPFERPNYSSSTELGPRGISLGGIAGNMDALDLPSDVDDETMVELAIALSLQEQQGNGVSEFQQGLQQLAANYDVHSLHEFPALQSLAGIVSSVFSPSDNFETPGGQGSDEEEESSSAPLETSNLPITPGSEPGSESGVEGEVSGRSSTLKLYSESGDNSESFNYKALHSHHIGLLDELLHYLPECKKVGGLFSIPFMQVVSMLTADLEASNDKDVLIFDKCLAFLLRELDLRDSNLMESRSSTGEFQLLILRLFGVLMSRSGGKGSFVATASAASLLKAGIVSHCLRILQNLLSYWKSMGDSLGSDESLVNNKVGSSSPLKNHDPYFPSDMTPFFLKQYIKIHSSDVFEAYPQLLTEMCLRIPYQAIKISQEETKDLTSEWTFTLCEYMMVNNVSYTRRLVRKFLLLLCGSKDRYRQLRDLHTLESHMTSIREIIGDGTSTRSFPYDTLLSLIEHLKATVDIGTAHHSNWQLYCSSKDSSALPFLLSISFHLEEGVTPLILQLVQIALSEDVPGIVSQIHGSSLLPVFLQKFLLECNSTSIRWQAHSLLSTLYRYCTSEEKSAIMEIMWNLWQSLSLYGRKASQFVDLLGYFSESHKNFSLSHHEEAVKVLKAQNAILSHHPNTSIYGSLAKLVDLHGYYLESDPCLVCNNPEVSYSSLKLSTLKVDTKYTTSSQIVKLSGSHSINRINLRIGDLNRQKMVRSICIYYNNRSVTAVVELKNKPTVWHKGKKVHLTPGQTEIKVEFPLPIIACNLRVEYSDFYENIQASTETLQCPRCSASVPANPGVCSNCGENVFQCHKCRSINYDEKNPFLCNACGFCKYAKFEYTLSSRPVCAVDPIETEEDYKKALLSVNTLLEKADKVYKQLMGNKPILESLLLKISSSPLGVIKDDELSISGSNSHVNANIQSLAHKYCGDCKHFFEELSKIVQRVIATRKELVVWENKKKKGHYSSCQFNVKLRIGANGSGKCFGCASASVEHSLTLLKALARSSSSLGSSLLQESLLSELMNINLKRGSPLVRHSVVKLICLLTRNNYKATSHLNALLFEKIVFALQGFPNAERIDSVRYEMYLLSYSMRRADRCWEERLKVVLRIFLLATNGPPCPMTLEVITLPCLQILRALIQSSSSSEVGAQTPLYIDHWLNGRISFSTWSTRSVSEYNVMNKYFSIWRKKSRRSSDTLCHLKLKEEKKKKKSTSWLKSVLFNNSCHLARETTCALLSSLCVSYEKHKRLLEVLNGFLRELPVAGEASSEYVDLYQKLIQGDWKIYLALRGALTEVSDLISDEIEALNTLEATSLSTDLAQGIALQTLTEILVSFASVDKIKVCYKSLLISTVLHGYLSLRKLIVQRTKLVDATQEKLLRLLEGLTTGNEGETEAFMTVCLQTLRRYPSEDQITPVFIFERLCNCIFPEECETGEFFLTLEKDPQQEDFLQGRMLGNPYSSLDTDLGPLLRDVKNKICRDCELVALLEDDNGMELLINNKIVSLDLLVKDVYQRIWLPDSLDGEPMRVLYRMRGLLGDATEEFIETLETKEGEETNEEELYKMAKSLAHVGGLEITLERFASIEDVSASKALLTVLLKLFGYLIKIQENRKRLLQDPSLQTIPLLLKALKYTLGEQLYSHSGIILESMERLLVEAAGTNSLSTYRQFASNVVTMKDIESLLNHAVVLKSGTSVHSQLMRVLPFLTFAHDDKMSLIVKHFTLNFEAFDLEHEAEEEAKLEAFVALCAGIERNTIGNTMKDLLLEMGIIEKCLEYMTTHAPPMESALLRADEPRWKEFVTKPSLKFILRILSGLATKHSSTQLAISQNSIRVLHQMEQVSSDEHVGSLAEAVLEAIKCHDSVGKIVGDVREQTKMEKKKLAMAMREKQLRAIGLKANEQGQVKADHSLLQQFVVLAEESGLCCNICREGYKFQPSKVLAIYTYTRECPVEEFESRSRKTLGYSTVTHFNLVHVDCHMAAVRQARARDEWESAMLQNANTRCNGLLPLWGPLVLESAFASCLAHHNTYLSEATQHRDIGFHSTVHDLKLLFLRFAEDKSFSSESGGGGPQSNMHFVPYLMHMALYVLNTTRSLSREEKDLSAFLESPPEKWIESSFLAQGPLYYAVIALLISSPSKWKACRIKILQRLLLTAHARTVNTSRTFTTLADREVKDYDVYKKIILFFALLDQLYSVVFFNVEDGSSDWSKALMEWIRNNDDALNKSTSKLLATFQEDLVPATSVDEIIDVCGLLSEIPSPASFLIEVLNLVP